MFVIKYIKSIHSLNDSLVYLKFKIQDWTDSKLPEQGLLSCFSVVPKVLLAGAITLMDEGYFKLAVWLNDKGMCWCCRLVV